MAKVFKPDRIRMSCAGYESVAHVPVLFDNEKRYCRVHNRYLREKALGEIGNGNLQPIEIHEPLADTSINNTASALGIHLDWCDATNNDWTLVDYKVGVLQFQNDMKSGRWSPTNKPLEASTANIRADEVTRFLSWAGQNNLRRPFAARYRESTRIITGVVTVVPAVSRSRRRIGRAKESRTASMAAGVWLPAPVVVRDWLQRLKERRGYAKYLAARFILETGTRADETVLITPDQIPQRETLEELARAGQIKAPVALEHTKGGRPRTILVAIPFLLDIRKWIDGKYMRLRWLWRKRTGKSPDNLLFLSDSRDHEGTAISYQTLYRCFKLKPGPKKWHPHFGRHAYACFTVLYALEREAKIARRTVSEMGADWAVSRGGWILKSLKKQLGHLNEQTTEMYLEWLSTAVGLAGIASGWHNYLAGDATEAEL